MLGKLTGFLAFLASVCVIVCGVMNVIDSFDDWCDVNSKGGDKCVGPWLFWNDHNDFDHDSNGFGSNGLTCSHSSEGCWRLVFSLRPEIFFDLWTPMFLGLISFMAHFSSLPNEIINKSWLRVMFWFIFVAAFGAFGYAGNWGIISGFACIVVSALSLLCAFVDKGSESKMEFVKIG